jgi:hypothetical protein
MHAEFQVSGFGAIELTWELWVDDALHTRAEHTYPVDCSTPHIYAAPFTFCIDRTCHVALWARAIGAVDAYIGRIGHNRTGPPPSTFPPAARRPDGFALRAIQDAAGRQLASKTGSLQFIFRRIASDQPFDAVRLRVEVTSAAVWSADVWVEWWIDDAHAISSREAYALCGGGSRVAELIAPRPLVEFDMLVIYIMPPARGKISIGVVTLEDLRSPALTPGRGSPICNPAPDGQISTSEAGQTRRSRPASVSVRSPQLADK